MRAAVCVGRINKAYACGSLFVCTLVRPTHPYSTDHTVRYRCTAQSNTMGNTAHCTVGRGAGWVALRYGVCECRAGLGYLRCRSNSCPCHCMRASSGSRIASATPRIGLGESRASRSCALCVVASAVYGIRNQRDLLHLCNIVHAEYIGMRHTGCASGRRAPNALLWRHAT